MRVERLEEKYLGIAGFREVRIAEVPSLIGAVRERIGDRTFLLLNADHVAGWEHLYFAALNALRAFQGGRNIAERLDIEILLYASCQDQISRAFTLVGLTPQTTQVALIVLADSAEEVEEAVKRATPLLGAADDSVLEIDEGKFQRLREVFSVSEEELEAVAGSKREASALTSLIVERCALLAVHR